ncbi:unnamed protein product [Clonostachys rhizophaga]|uniref:DUF6546 domain-containing protein n=1 Tax=Clonostachys rhizophaga TaxID=160324 RepID=A0A9N9VP29_9HYPO|nr:unnamed protein product [Clonostachys rhizophaga]
MLRSFEPGLPPKLTSAAAAAARMPKLGTIELCNGRKGLEATLQYRGGVGVTGKVTWELFLELDVIKAGEAVAFKYHSRGLFVMSKDILGFGANVELYGDAIEYLKLVNPVIRLISLQ